MKKILVGILDHACEECGWAAKALLELTGRM